MLKSLFSTLFLFGWVAACNPAPHESGPEEHVVVLKEGLLTVDGERGMQFAIDASVGDVLHIFHSDPDFSHAFYISDEKYGMDVGNIVEIGDHYDIRLDHPGTFEIACSHMDDMKVTVSVSP